MEVEANFTSTGKSRSKIDPGERKKGKEEATSSSHGRESQEQKLEEMDKLIKNLSNTLVKLELENKNLPRQNSQAPNRGFKP